MNINATEKRDKEYYSHVRLWPRQFNLRKKARFLDVGCGQGNLGVYLKENLDAYVCGVEITTENYNVALSVLDKACFGDIETVDMTELGANYDYVIFSDSLEHFVSPDVILLKIKKIMVKDGAVLIALPNVRNFRVTLPLLFKDSWEYTDEGLLDKTHLRFFTKKSITQLLNEKGFEIRELYYDLPLLSKVGLLNIITFGLFKNILTSHYYIKAQVR